MKKYSFLALFYVLFSIATSVFITACSFITLDVDTHVSQRSLLTKGDDDKVSLQRGNDIQSETDETTTDLEVPIGVE